MTEDPETLSYTCVDDVLLGRMAAAYRRGLDECLAELRIVNADGLPRLTFAGHSSDREPWTVLETSQGTHWYFGGPLMKEGELVEMAYEFGRTEADDYWGQPVL